ncbi:MAG: hypothetical protein VYD19_08310 [Myxococcota bacterium]|nr:hypothetical protein [Myxococcota bacterium]
MMISKKLSLSILLIALSSSGCEESSSAADQGEVIARTDQASGSDRRPADAMLDQSERPAPVADAASADATSADATQARPDQGIPAEDMELDQEDATPEGEAVITVENAAESCGEVSLLAPSLPGEAGHYVATLLTPATYPFSIEQIQYPLVTDRQTPSCNGALAHRVLLFAIDAGETLPETPSSTGLGYREYEVPEESAAVEGRLVEITVPIPLILTEGQRAVVAIQFATAGDEHICVASCNQPGGVAGLDWWSNAAEAPFSWQDLIADFGLTGQLMTQVQGRVIRD